jgi:hypothetical protein
LRPVAVLIAIAGILILLAGIVFVLQGMGIVGPSSSFMYNNPTWIYQGAAAAVVGILVLIGGVFLGRRNTRVGPSS